jgi:hypothetical protein
VNDRQGEHRTLKLLGLVGALFLGATLFQHAETLRTINFISHDDMGIDLIAAGGFPAWVEWRTQIAQQQGRVGYYVSAWAFLAPFLPDSDIVRSLMGTSAQFLSLLALGVFVGLYLGRAVTAVFLLLVYALMPYWWQHFPIGAYPVIYHAAVLFSFAGIALYVVACRQADAHGHRRTGTLVAGLLLLFLGLFFYETVTFVAMGVCVCVMYAETPQAPGAGYWARSVLAVRKHWYLPAIIGLYGVLYLSYRLAHPSAYNGSTVDSRAFTNLAGIGRAVWLFGITGLPGINFFWRLGTTPEFALGSVSSDGTIRFVANNLTLYGFLAGCLFGWIVWAIARNTPELLHWGESAPRLPGTRWLGYRPPRGTGSLLRWAGAATLAAFLLLVPTALSPKYQQDPLAWAPYIPGYFAYVAFSLALACLALFIFRLSRTLSSRWCNAVPALSACAAAAVFLLNFVASGTVIRSQKDHYAKWRLVRMFAKTDVFETIPRGAVIVAPSLWKGISPAFSGYDNYWSVYFAKHLGKPVRVIRRVPESADGSGGGPPLYYLGIDGGVETRDATLMFGPLRINGVGFVSDAVYLLGWRDFKRRFFSYVSTDCAAGCEAYDLTGQITGLQRTIPIPAGKHIPGGFISHVELADANLDSAAVITRAPEPPVAPALEVEFKKGFAGYETRGGTYWRWSDGASGEGVLSITNHFKLPLKARFATQILTGRDQPGKFTIDAGGKMEDLAVRNGQTFAEDLVLLPGENEIKIHSFAGRLLVNDPRYIVFGLQNWTLTDAGSKKLVDNLNIATPGKDVELVFSQGFAGFERQGSSYWRWSDAASGTGILKFVNHAGHPLEILFEATITDGYLEADKCDIMYGREKKTILVNNSGARISLRLTVPDDGLSMTLKCFAPRVPAPGDPRYMVFAVHNWRVLME